MPMIFLVSPNELESPTLIPKGTVQLFELRDDTPGQLYKAITNYQSKAFATCRTGSRSRYRSAIRSFPQGSRG